jgi:apolipoprotein N-acyltransferase
VVLTGFPWAMIGHVWIDTPVAQLAAWTGAAGLSLLTLALAAALAQAGYGARARVAARPAAAALVVLGGGWLAGEARLAAPGPSRAICVCGWCSPMPRRT